MRINGEWQPDENGVLNPVLRCELLTGSGEWEEVYFLVDSGAELTVISSDVLRRIDAPAHVSLQALVGIGAEVRMMTVSTKLRLKLDSNATINVNGPFAGLEAGREDELSILGRDVLGNFAVILDRPGALIALLHGRHHYSIHEAGP